MKKLMTWIMLGVMLVCLFIIQSSNVIAAQQDVSKASTSLKSESKLKSNSSSTKDTSEIVSSKSVSNSTSSSSDEAESSTSSKSSSKSTESVLVQSSSSGKLPSIESVKEANEQLVNGKSTSKSVGVSPDGFNDGITDWKEVPQNTIEYLPLDDPGVKLGYTFGNSDGSLKSEYNSNDPAPTTRDYVDPKTNVFILANGKIINGFHKGNQGLTTSYGYALTTETSNQKQILAETSIPYLMDKGFKIYEGTTSYNKPALKAVGIATVKGVKLKVEFVLRPSEEQPVIKQEMYLQDVGTGNETVRIFYAEDTELDDNQGPDIYAQGNRNGMYMMEKGYKFIMQDKIADGPDHYQGIRYQTAGAQMDTQSKYGMADYTYYGSSLGGADLSPFTVDEGSLVAGAGDSALSAMWEPQTLDATKVYHYRNDVGFFNEGVVVPEAVVSYTNNTTTDKKNHVLDEITLNFATHNIGFKSVWDNITMTATIPAGLTVDPKTMKAKLNDGSEVNVDVKSYNASTHKITYKLPKDLADNEWTTVSVDTKINSKASNKTLQPSMVSQGGKALYNKASAQTDIPVELAPTVIDKTVRNESEKETEYQDTTQVHARDVLGFKLKFTVDEKSSTMKTTALLDEMDKKLELVKETGKKPIKVDYSDGTTAEFDSLGSMTLKQMEPGDSATITYKAKVMDTAIEGDILSNKVTTLSELPDTSTTASESEVSMETVKPKDSKVHFEYIDRATGKAINDPITVQGKIGEHVSTGTIIEGDLNGSKDVNKIRPAYIEGYTPVEYTIDANTAPEKLLQDIDPAIAMDEVTYKIYYEKARLGFTALPKKMYFGKFYDTKIDRTFYMPAPKDPAPKSMKYQKTPYSVEISDYWGIDSWALDVKQVGQFQSDYKGDSNTPSKHVELEGARLQFSNAKFLMTYSEGKSTEGSGKGDKTESLDHFNLVPNGTPRRLVTHKKEGQFLHKDNTNGSVADDGTDNRVTYDRPGYAVYKYQFGDEKTADYSIGLFVPGATKRYNTTYSTTLLWNLTVAP